MLGTRETADGVAAQLEAAGWTGRIEPVRMPRFADAGPDRRGRLLLVEVDGLTPPPTDSPSPPPDST